MPILRTKDGRDIEVSWSDITGEKREDGRFHAKHKDGTEGIIMRESELDAEREENAKVMREWLEGSGTKEPDDDTDFMEELRKA